MNLPPVRREPCFDCPWRRNAAPGWLGPYSAARWLAIAQGDAPIACHLTVHDTEWEQQCAGAASFRANIHKSPRDPEIACGPPSEQIFTSGQEFLTYHGSTVEEFLNEMYG